LQTTVQQELVLPASAPQVAIIADDEDIGRLLLAESTHALGLTPSTFDNGTEALAAALAAARAGELAIVLLDVDMPGMDGHTVCRRLRSAAQLTAVPIVMVTGHEDSEAVTRAFEAGATDFVSKPVNWSLLPRRLEYILRNAASARALAERVTQVRTLVEAIPDTLWVVAPDGRIRWSPHAAAAAEPLAPAEHLPQVLAAIHQTARDGAQRRLQYRELNAAASAESVIVPGQPSDADEARSYELRFSRREGGDVVVVRQDTSERTAAAERIERLAYFDPLTGLPNRQRCIETAEALFADADRLRQSVAVVYLDLNSFKRINDAFGHAVGDAVLRTVAMRLIHTLESCRCDGGALSVARFGGDEFVILLRHSAVRPLAGEVSEACRRAFLDPITYEGLEFYPAPSIGVAVYPDDGPDVATVLKNADTAMYQAKSVAAQSVAVYAPAMSSRLRDWLDLEVRLRHAVQQEGLMLQFQPKFRLRDQRLVGVEALLRWRDAELGDIPPSRFIEIAEDSGLIIELGGWVIRAVCRQLREWQARGIALPVAINVSGKQMLHGDVARVIEAEAAAAGIAPSLLEVEITESLLIKDSATVREALERLRALGCRIALDDFGTGYSSLAYISRFPPDRLKIDQSFVRQIDQSARDAAIANAILALAHSLDVIVTAEGVERIGQLEWLRARGCDEVQGFLLSRPLAARELEERLLASRD
jgi:diguanylate cyclase (GGDEF)-like protein